MNREPVQRCPIVLRQRLILKLAPPPYPFFFIICHSFYAGTFRKMRTLLTAEGKIPSQYLSKQHGDAAACR